MPWFSLSRGHLHSDPKLRLKFLLFYKHYLLESQIVPCQVHLECAVPEQQLTIHSSEITPWSTYSMLRVGFIAASGLKREEDCSSCRWLLKCFFLHICVFRHMLSCVCVLRICNFKNFDFELILWNFCVLRYFVSSRI